MSGIVHGYHRPVYTRNVSLLKAYDSYRGGELPRSILSLVQRPPKLQLRLLISALFRAFDTALGE
jgi:hypothetical protein